MLACVFLYPYWLFSVIAKIYIFFVCFYITCLFARGSGLCNVCLLRPLQEDPGRKATAGIKYSSISFLSRNMFYSHPLCYLRKQMCCWLYVNAVQQVLHCDVTVFGKPIFHASTSQRCERDKPRSLLSLGYFKYQQLLPKHWHQSLLKIYTSHLLCEKETWSCVLFPWYTLDRIQSPCQ